MNAKDAIRCTMNTADFMLESYLSDITPEEMFVRPAPGANHLAWQLGHLITSEHEMISALGHKMPELPAGFVERYTRESARSDQPRPSQTRRATRRAAQ